MKKLMLTLLAFQTSQAANYLPLSNSMQLYDIEVIVFARQLIQGDSFTFNNRDELDLSELNSMLPVGPDVPWIFEPEKTDAQEDQWQVPIDEEEPNNAKALAWFSIDNSGENSAVFKRIDQHPNMRGLFYQKWRQPATPYLNPGFIKISTWEEDNDDITDDLSPLKLNNDSVEEEQAEQYGNETEIRQNTQGSNQVSSPLSYSSLNGFNYNQNIDIEPPKPDYTIRGKVAFSKQRYQHAHVDLNLYRNSQDELTLIYRLEQNSQVEPEQWHYYDHPQFGLLFRVTVTSDYNNPELE